MEINTFPYLHKVQYYETDQMAVVHNANYLRWFEEARTYFMELIGLPYAKMEEMGLIIMVTSSRCDYKSPVRYGETARIEQRLTFFNGYKMTVQYRVLRDSDGTLCAVGETRHALLSKDFKPVRLTKQYPEVYELFRGYTFPLEPDEEEIL